MRRAMRVGAAGKGSGRWGARGAREAGGKGEKGGKGAGCKGRKHDYGGAAAAAVEGEVPSEDPAGPPTSWLRPWYISRTETLAASVS